VLATAPGCRFFERGRSFLATAETGSGTVASASGSLLSSIPISRHAIELEILFVERPVGDPLLGDPLWNEVDELTVQPQLRRSLREHGFLTGVTGASPPRALQTLLGMGGSAWEPPDESKRLVGRRVVLPSGSETEIPTSYYRAERIMAVPLADGRSEYRTYENGLGVLRLRAFRLQEGFARLEILPEIHHGPIINRPTATPAGWRYETGQKSERLYDQRFSVDLNVGEFAVVTTDGQNPDSVGHHFFIVSGVDGEERKIHRVLVVRLSGMAKSDPERVE
jgi:hypothetical protein